MRDRRSYRRPSSGVLQVSPCGICGIYWPWLGLPHVAICPVEEARWSPLLKALTGQLPACYWKNGFQQQKSSAIPLCRSVTDKAMFAKEKEIKRQEGSVALGTIKVARLRPFSCSRSSLPRTHRWACPLSV